MPNTGQRFRGGGHREEGKEHRAEGMEKGNRRRETGEGKQEDGDRRRETGEGRPGEGRPGERRSYVVGREHAMVETFHETSPLITKIGELMAPATFPSLRSFAT
jgi:hypothetical protein